MKNLFCFFFGIGAILVYGLAILGFIIGNESEVFFLSLGLLGGVYAVLYLVFEKYI